MTQQTTIEKQSILDTLHAGEVMVEFTKTNGETRKMLCTLATNLVPAQPVTKTTATPKAPRKENPNVQAVWDLEKQAWRSFRFDSVKSIEFRDGQNFESISK